MDPCRPRPSAFFLEDTMTFQFPQMLLALALAPLLLALYNLEKRRRNTYAVRFTNLTLLQ